MEKLDIGARKRAAVMRWLADREMALSRQGYVVETWREYRGRRLGPYYRLRYREEGRRCSLYLGRDAALAEDVRGRLRELQAPLRRKREDDKLWKQRRAYLRQLKARWGEELAKIGLRLKGFEVRGPVTAALRAYFAAEGNSAAASCTASNALPETPPLPRLKEGNTICGKTAIRCPKEYVAMRPSHKETTFGRPAERFSCRNYRSRG